MKTMKMNLLLKSLFLTWFWIFTLQGSAQKNHENSLFWQISGNGLEKPSYLFGTFHIIDSAYYIMEDKVNDKISHSEIIALEVDMDDPDFQKKTISVLMMENDSLDALLTQEEYHNVKSFYAKNLNMDLDNLKNIKPYYLSVMVGRLNVPENTMSYEQEIIKIAKGQDKEIIGISTVEKESEILVDNIPLEMQASMLLDAIKELDHSKEIQGKMLKLYLEHDIYGIFNLIKEETADRDIIFLSMLPERHKIWIPNMIDIMKDHSCFFAIGVGHLAGKEGVIEKLRENGFTVKPVTKD